MRDGMRLAGTDSWNVFVSFRAASAAFALRTQTLRHRATGKRPMKRIWTLIWRSPGRKNAIPLTMVVWPDLINSADA